MSQRGRRNLKRKRDLRRSSGASFSSIFVFAIVVLVSASCFSSLFTTVSSQDKLVYALDYNQTITVASSEYLKEGLDKASGANAECIVLMLNTFGGDLDSTLKMIEYMETSTIPVVVYVYPGAKAWSAGAFLMMGSHVAAMAPGTVVGSSQPVSYSPLGGSTPVTDDKIINALSTYIREKATLHGRNATVAERFVTQNLNLPAEDARASLTIEILAGSLENLVQQLDGRNVTVRGGNKILSTYGASIVSISPSLPIMLLRIITDPNLSSILFLIGLYALIYGVLTPGYGGEIFGGVLIVLSLVGMGLDFNIVALMLIVIGVGLLLGELQTPGWGVLGAGGVICITLGSLLLFPRQPPKWLLNTEWFQVFATATIGSAIVMGGILAVISYKALKTKRMKTKMFQIVGETGTATEDIPKGEEGYVRCMGELWRARSEYNLKKDEKVKVVAKEGHILLVEPLTKRKK